MRRLLLLLLGLISPINAGMCSSAGWSDNDRWGILNVHNNLRSKIARGVYSAGGTKKGPARDMIKMIYDCGLEASAQRWANSCPSSHSGSHENIHWRYSSGGLNIAGQGAIAANEWEKELQQHGWSSNRMESGIGHATQMAWSSTWKVGCGVKRCQSGRQIVVVCHYDPAGNYVNQNVFSHGSTCSACPGGTTCDSSTGLCSTGQNQGGTNQGEDDGGQWTTNQVTHSGTWGVDIQKPFQDWKNKAAAFQDEFQKKFQQMAKQQQKWSMSW